MTIEVEVEGLDRIIEAMKRFPKVVTKNMAAAGLESLNVILDTQGLRQYPPETAANRPPTPYYKRGVGMQYKDRNTGSSERYSTKWRTEVEAYIAKATNIASYAKYLADEAEQVFWARTYGWRILVRVAREKLSQIIGIYDSWVKKTIEELGL